MTPRHPATIEQDILLYLVPHIVLRGGRTHGEERERVIVRRAGFHFSPVSIRSRPIKRVKKPYSGIPGAAAREEREDSEDKDGREGRVDTVSREVRETGEEGGERI